MLALSTALFTAALALIGNVIFSHLTRRRDMQGLAGALAGEIEAYVLLFSWETTSKGLSALINMNITERIEYLKSNPQMPLTCPVFDKVVDKLGSLPPDEARDVSRFYNVVTGLRIHLGFMSSAGFLDASDAIQRARIETLAGERTASELRSGLLLVQRLRRLRDASVWQFIGECF